MTTHSYGDNSVNLRTQGNESRRADTETEGEGQGCKGGGPVSLPWISTPTPQHLCFSDTPQPWAHPSLELLASSEQQSEVYMAFHPPEKAIYFSTASEWRKPMFIMMILGCCTIFWWWWKIRSFGLKPGYSSESPGKLGKIFFLRALPSDFDLVGLFWYLRISIFNKHPRDYRHLGTTALSYIWYSFSVSYSL